MADIALCNDRTCPSREHCRRATTPPKGWQVYSLFLRDGRDRCGEYLPARRESDD